MVSAHRPRSAVGPFERDIVLVGGGHSHVEVLRRFAMRPQAGTRLILIARDVDTPYSGMLPGYLAGHYRFDECHIDLRQLCRKVGASLLHAEADGIDLERKLVRCRHRPEVPFDFLSLDIGSVPRLSHIEGAARYAIPIKPVDGFLSRWMEIEQQLEESRGPFRVVIIGGGAGGVEVSLSLRHRLTQRLRRLGRGPEGVALAVVADTATLLPQHPSPVRRRLERWLDQRQIAVHTGHRAVRVAPGMVECEPALSLEADAVVIVTQASAPPWLRETGLSLDPHGFVRVGETLQSTSHERVFAVGDIASFEPRALPKNGVYAVREGPVLAHNLFAVASGRVPEPFRPQSRTLALISTGTKHAIASYGGVAFEGEWVWKVKDHIDRRWMRRYQGLREMAPAGEAMRCGGCGAKVPADVLRKVLDGLRREDPSDILVGLKAPDDAAVFVPPPDTVAVQTVDQFRSFIDDLYIFARITTNHCLNDVYSMGATPKTALAMVTLPYAAPAKMEADLRQLLSGALEELDAARVALVGGHTAEGAELGLGLSITGFADRAELWRKHGLREGDVLILTKPLGTGVILAGEMRACAESGWVEGALECMLLSNAGAVGILRRHRASACTDVTGFGLLGHLGEMLRASRCHADLHLGAVPVLAGAETLLRRGVASTLHAANSAHANGLTDAAPVPDAVLFDPQTAGGLLAGVPADLASACLTALRVSGYAQAQIVGSVTPGAPGKITLIAAQATGGSVGAVGVAEPGPGWVEPQPVSR